MYMTASRIKIEEKPVLKLNIHDFNNDDVSFLDSLGIDQQDDNSPGLRYIHIHSQEDFHTTRSAILEKYNVIEERGPKVFLEVK